MGVFWFRVHNWWAWRLQQFYENNATNYSYRANNDEFIFNRARQFTIATYQVSPILYNTIMYIARKLA